MYYDLSDENKKRLDTNFIYHSPKEDQPKRYEEIRRYAYSYAEWLMERCPPSRELSLALTALEECVMWANASIARNE